MHLILDADVVNCESMTMQPLPRVNRDTGGVKVESFNIGTMTNSDKDYISFKLEGLKTLKWVWLVQGNEERMYCLSGTSLCRLSLQINIPFLLVSRQNLGI